MLTNRIINKKLTNKNPATKKIHKMLHPLSQIATSVCAHWQNSAHMFDIEFTPNVSLIIFNMMLIQYVNSL